MAWKCPEILIKKRIRLLINKYLTCLFLKKLIILRNNKGNQIKTKPMVTNWLQLNIKALKAYTKDPIIEAKVFLVIFFASKKNVIEENKCWLITNKDQPSE